MKLFFVNKLLLQGNQFNVLKVKSIYYNLSKNSVWIQTIYIVNIQQKKKNESKHFLSSETFKIFFFNKNLKHEKFCQITFRNLKIVSVLDKYLYTILRINQITEIL